MSYKALVLCYLIMISSLSNVLVINAASGFLKDCKSERESARHGVCLPEDYDKHEMPKKPLNVETSISIVQITEIDDTLSTVDILLYLHFKWEDDRLILSNDTNKHIRQTAYGKDSFLLNSDWNQKLWFPDIFIYKMKEINFQRFREDFGGDI